MGGVEVNQNFTEYNDAIDDPNDVMTITALSSGQKLGGSGAANPRLPMREALLQAALKRVSEEEQQITDGCGSHQKITAKENKIVQAVDKKPKVDTLPRKEDISQAVVKKEESLENKVAQPVVMKPKEDLMSRQPDVSQVAKEEVVKSSVMEVESPVSVCPFCGFTFDSKASNREINKHIDQHISS